MKIKNLQFFSITVALLFILFSSSNIFSQWTFVGGIVGAGTYPSISVSDANTVFVFGGPNGQPRVFRSTNGGTNWHKQGSYVSGSPQYYQEIVVDRKSVV